MTDPRESWMPDKYEAARRITERMTHGIWDLVALMVLLAVVMGVLGFLLGSASVRR